MARAFLSFPLNQLVVILDSYLRPVPGLGERVGSEV